MPDLPEKKRLDVDPIQLAAGSLAAVTSAVAGSYLGVGGTLVGAGVGSVVATVGGAVYGHYLERTRQQVRSVVLRAPLRPRDSAPRSGADSAPTLRSSSTAQADPSVAATRPTGPRIAPAATAGDAPAMSEKDLPTGAWLRSRRFALGASMLATFGVTLGVIAGVEAVSRKPVSAMVQGTDNEGSSTLGEVFGGRPAPDATPAPTATTTPTPPTTGEPTPTPTPPDSASPQPTETPTSEPGTTTPTPQPAITETPAPVPTTPAAG